MQSTLSEREMLHNVFDREYETTLKVLRAFPSDKMELKPAEKSKSARDLAWMLVLNQMVITPTVQGKLEPGLFPEAPQTMREILEAFEREHETSSAKLATLTDDQLSRTITLPVGPGQMADVRVAEALWMFLHDTIHHRGQFSVYVRMAGGKLPSIYGPTADEPWW